jgi:hypothetical protein
LRKSIEYFESPGLANTEETIRLARERAIELGIRDVVVASTHGGTGLKVAEAFKDLDCNLVVVTVSEAFEDEGWVMTREERQGLVERGIKVYTGVHALGDGVDSAFAERSTRGFTPSVMASTRPSRKGTGESPSVRSWPRRSTVSVRERRHAWRSCSWRPMPG